MRDGLRRAHGFGGLILLENGRAGLEGEHLEQRRELRVRTMVRIRVRLRGWFGGVISEFGLWAKVRVGTWSSVESFCWASRGWLEKKGTCSAHTRFSGSSGALRTECTLGVVGIVRVWL